MSVSRIQPSDHFEKGFDKDEHIVGTTRLASPSKGDGKALSPRKHQPQSRNSVERDDSSSTRAIYQPNKQYYHSPTARRNRSRSIDDTSRSTRTSVGILRTPPPARVDAATDTSQNHDCLLSSPLSLSFVSSSMNSVYNYLFSPSSAATTNGNERETNEESKKSHKRQVSFSFPIDDDEDVDVVNATENGHDERRHLDNSWSEQESVAAGSKTHRRCPARMNMNDVLFLLDIHDFHPDEPQVDIPTLISFRRRSRHHASSSSYIGREGANDSRRVRSRQYSFRV